MKVGPFFIKNVKGLVNYEFQLLVKARIYPIFYISRLKK